MKTNYQNPESTHYFMYAHYRRGRGIPVHVTGYSQVPVKIIGAHPDSSKVTAEVTEAGRHPYLKGHVIIVYKRELKEFEKS